MANPIVTAVAASAPVAPMTGKAPAAGGGAQEGPSFKDLLAGAEASATPLEGDRTGGEEPSLTQDGGEDTPPDGNPLPLASPLLPPAQSVTVIALPAIEEGAAPPAPSAPATATATAKGPVEADATALPADPLPAPLAKDAAAATPVDDAAPAAVPAPVVQKAAQSQQTPEQAPAAPASISPQRNASDADTGAGAGANPGSSSAAALASQLTGGDEGIDDEAMRRLFTSLSGTSGAQDAAARESTAPAGHKGASTAQSSLPPHLNALPLATQQAAETPATATDRLLRELRFDRAPEVTTQAPTVATHPASLQSQTAAAAATNDTPVMQLQTPMQNRAEWANSLGERISWMTANNQQNAHIRLNPAHLGPIEVQVSVTGDQTNISFTAHHAATRDALEAAAPRLREMLSANGQSSVNVNINHQSPGDRPAQAQPQELWSRYDGGMQADNEGVAGVPRQMPTPGRGRLDTYA